MLKSKRAALRYYESSRTKEVLLFLHSEPSTTINNLIKHIDILNEVGVTVVFYDVLNIEGSKEGLDNTVIVELLKQLIEYLRYKYCAYKVVVVGQSWASTYALDLVNTYPELVSYYIGISQIIDAPKQEEYALNSLIQKTGKTSLQHTFSDYPNTNDTKLLLKQFKKVKQLERWHNIINRNDSLYNQMVTDQPYKDQIHYLLQYHSSLNTNVPYYFINGAFDSQTPVSILNDFLKLNDYPLNHVHLIIKAGHALTIEHHCEVLNICKDIIKHEEDKRKVL